MQKKLIGLLLLLGLGQVFGQDGKYRFLVGTYTQKSSQGIYYCEFDESSKKIKIISNSEKLDNPSFLTVSKNQNFVYSVSETDGGSIDALKFDTSSGNFLKLNSVASGGAHPCHIALDHTGQWLFSGNYTGGSLAVIKIQNSGGINQPHQVIQHMGSGPNISRQEKPHVHSVNISPDNKNLLVADLGTDQIINYSFYHKTGKLAENQVIKVSSGSGPRHLTFHPTLPYVYIIQELTGKVSVFSFKNRKLNFIEEVSSLPEGFNGQNSSADIHVSPDGKFLYASNRYLDTVVSFSIDSKTGKISQLNQTSVKGKLPRNFGITPDGKYLLVANQGTDNIVVFKLEGGKMVDTGLELKISMPVCVKFLK